MIDSLRYAKIAWHCRRGMLELDIILGRFIERHLNHLSEAQIKDFELLLTYPDPDVFVWLMGSVQTEEPELVEIVDYIKQHDKV